MFQWESDAIGGNGAGLVRRAYGRTTGRLALVFSIGDDGNSYENPQTVISGRRGRCSRRADDREGLSPRPRRRDRAER